MTLNVTVLTETRIFQSSDFRLTAGVGNYSDSTMKLVTLQYPTFSGLISYTGYAKDRMENPQDTARRIVNWLERSPNIQFHEAVELLRSNATSYIADVERQTGIRHRLTLIAAAFVNTRPIIAVISNYESVYGRESSNVGQELITSWGKLGAGASPKVIITGCKPAVSPASREALEQLVRRAGEDSARIRHAIEDLNRYASRSKKWGSGISEHCSVVSMDSSGSGLQDLTQGSEVTTHSITNGLYIDLAAVLESIGIKGTVVGASFGTSKPTTRRAHECERALVENGCTEFQLTELTHTVDADCNAFDINSNGVIIGASSSSDNRSWHQYWKWEETTGLSNLNYWSQNCSAAINNSGIVALNTVTQEGRSALVVLAGQDERLLEIPGSMMEPEVTSINASGIVGGAISINQDVTDADRTRPAVWGADGTLTVLDQLCGAENGRVVSLNRHGLALVWANRGPWGRLPLVWDLNSGQVKPLPPGVIPLSITETGQVVGIIKGADGQHKPAISFDYESWAELAVNFGFSPNSANDQLAIVGSVTADGYPRPWMTRANSSPILLPAYQYHSVIPRAINSRDFIVGQASTDHEHHVLLWQPNTNSQQLSNS